DGLTPIELLEASLGMCITISLQKMFERDGIEVLEDEFSVSVSAAKAPEGPSRVEKCSVSVKLPEHLPTDYKKKLITSAERACTIGNTLKRGVTIDTNMV
ncbi:OsmC family protein, partial [Bacillus paralicheniformis]